MELDRALSLDEEYEADTVKTSNVDPARRVTLSPKQASPTIMAENIFRGFLEGKGLDVPDDIIIRALIHHPYLDTFTPLFRAVVAGADAASDDELSLLFRQIYGNDDSKSISTNSSTRRRDREGVSFGFEGNLNQDGNPDGNDAVRPNQAGQNENVAQEDQPQQAAPHRGGSTDSTLHGEQISNQSSSVLE